jgi:aminopeptidase-like protein
VLPGETEEEVLFSTYLCHPSMANNELSGPLAQAFLYEKLAALPKRRFTYRFLFAPETIGVIAFLAERGELLKKQLQAGYVLT